jgi:acetyl-CoA synthetase
VLGEGGAAGTVPPRMNFVEDVLEQFPAARPALVAIDESGARRTWGFGELVARSAGLGGALMARGVGRGDVVMTLIGNRPEWVLSMLACFRIGAVALPCNTQLRGKDLELRVRVAKPALAIGEADLLANLPAGVETMDLEEVGAVLDEERSQAAPADAANLDPGDPALIVFTSGTTGEARAAVHPQRYLTGQRLQAEHWFGAREGELAWCTAASGWSKSARNSFIAPWLQGATALLHAGRFHPAERLEICEREGVNVLCQAPTEYRMLAKRTELRPIPGLRRLVSAGEPLNPEVIRAFREGTGLEIHDGYGQTETGALTGSIVGEDLREGSMGKPLPGIEVRIEDGELQLRHESCPTFFSHYIGSEPYAEEWWRTGDLVSEDEDGYLWFEGRTDDVIVSSGYRIGPFEVESALVSHPAVAEAAAVSAPDPERGAVVRAVVVLRDREPSDELVRELQEHVRAETAPYKYPRIIDFADSLPKTPSGKIRRAELRGS